MANGLYLPDGTASFPEFTDLADRVVNGDGVTWGGDPSLWLGVGVVENRKTGKRGIRLEVWRHTDEGRDVLIGHWHPSEQFRVCSDLAEMRLGRPGAVSVEERIDKHNDKLEADRSAKRQDQMAAWLERKAYALMREQGHAKNRFAVPGRRDAS